MELLACLLVGALIGAGLYRFIWTSRLGRDAGRPAPVDDTLELALWASGEELWDLDVATGRQIRRGHIPDLDRSQPSSESSMEAFLARVHPDDRAAVSEAVQRVAVDAQAHAEVSYRVRHQSGSWAWLHSRGRAVAHAPDGAASRIVGTTRDITALKQHEERLDFALRAAGEELWEVDRSSDEIRRENPLVSLEYRAGDFRLTRQEFGELMHPDDVDRVSQDFLSVLSGEHLEFSAVYRLRRQDGRYAWIHSQGSGLDPDDRGRPLRVLGTSRDITPLKAAEERLRLSLWGSRAELWDIDMNSGLIQRECRLEHLALGGGSIVFGDLWRIAHTDDTVALKRAMVEHAKGGSESFEAQYRLRDVHGDWRWVLACGRVTERSPDGWALRMLGTLHDITEIKRVEDELRHLNEDLEQRVALRTADLSQANEELGRIVQRLGETQAQLVESEKMASLGSLVAGVAHEINTPLGVSVTAASHLSEELAGLEQALHDGSPDATQTARQAAVIRQCADLVLRNLDRADKLVKSFKQVAVDQSSEQMRQIVLKQYLEEILVSLHPRLHRTGHRVDIECPLEIELLTYPGAIYQTVTNLVLNSLVHGFEGVDNGVVRIAARETPEHVVIDYRDDGQGMSVETRKRVFDPFFTTRRGQGGTGLGMHIAYNLVTQLLGGSIRCESKLGAGVHFEVRVPRNAPSPA